MMLKGEGNVVVGIHKHWFDGGSLPLFSKENDSAPKNFTPTERTRICWPQARSTHHGVPDWWTICGSGRKYSMLMAHSTPMKPAPTTGTYAPGDADAAGHAEVSGARAVEDEDTHKEALAYPASML